MKNRKIMMDEGRGEDQQVRRAVDLAMRPLPDIPVVAETDRNRRSVERFGQRCREGSWGSGSWLGLAVVASAGRSGRLFEESMHKLRVP